MGSISSAVLCAAVLSACATAPSHQAVQQVRGQQNPADRAQRAITNFTPALRCMDDLMFRIGTRDVTLMMEELRDATQKVPVSARDMMTSAISEMTRRSRAVRLSVFGSDQQNLTQALQQAQKTSPFAVLPEYNLRGTISQLDEDVKRDSSAFGFLTSQAFGFRLGGETKFSVLGFDAAVVRTDTMTLMPGVASKNTTVIAKRDSSAGDGQARILNAATVFSFSAARSEGASQAARNMVELAAIELVGKLIRAPYWLCVGTPDNHPEVLRETEDWFLSMDEPERIGFFKERMRERRYFDGALDETAGPDFDAALRDYRRALGLSAQGPADLDFFRRFVAQPVHPGPLAALPRTARLVPQAGVAASSSPSSSASEAGSAAAASDDAPKEASQKNTAPADAATPVSLLLQPAAGGQHVRLQVSAAAPGYVYCYAQDPASQAIRRIFPNRFVRDPRVEAGRTVSLPGAGRFRLHPGHRYACVHAPREVYNDLPPPLRWGDFDDIRLPSFDAIQAQFAAASGLSIALVRPTPAAPR
ncbi:MAG: hypothetical protein AD742_10960 [Methylibium sp. NZG]|nr:MAG: hypothetical protein AD742_10960 [Methylibium sp. NZG]